MNGQLKPIKRALLSVTNKDLLISLGRFLADHKVELVASGGTAKKLKAEGLNVTEISDITAFPEIMGGRVKTLHPAVHGGILANRSESSHMQLSLIHI